MNINILFPVLNEEFRLRNGITKTLEYMENNSDIDFLLTIVDNGSTDKTEEISQELCAASSRVRYIKTPVKGVGTAFREGVKNNTCDIVGYMDVDLSTDITHIREVINIFKDMPDVMMVNGSRLNKKSVMTGRKWFRNLTSHGLSLILKLTLKMRASDSICGFKFYRKKFVEEIIKEADASENSWFFIIELLIRAERKGANIYELPVRWEDDPNTTVNTGKLIKHYLKQIRKLKKRLKEER